MKSPSAFLLSLILSLFPFQAISISSTIAQNPVNLNLQEFDIRNQLQQATQAKDWQKAIELVDKLISIESEPQKLRALREYRASLQSKLASSVQQEEPEPVPEVDSQPPIPKPKVDPSAPPSSWANIKLQKILKARTLVLAAAISPSGKTLVTGGERTLEIWDLSTDKSRLITDWIPQEYPISYNAIAFHPDGQTFATNSSGVAKKESGSRGCTSTDTTSSFSWSCNLGSSSETIFNGGSATQIWNVESGKQLLTFPIPGGGFGFGGSGFLSSTNLVSFSREGTVLLAIAGDLFPAKIWDTKTGKQLFNSRSDGFYFCQNATLISPDGKQVALVEFGNESVDLYNVQTGKKISSLTSSDFSALAGCPSFSPDGKMVAFAKGSRVTVWWLSTGEVLHDINTPNETTGMYARSAIFSPDSQVLAVGNIKKAIGLYDMRSGKRITTLSGSFIGFHPSATSLITAEELNVKIWNLP
ncbi:WD40 repeat domain-containing protein [Aliterella atlantica]|uniref:WD40 repeat-containing protein n=1 Tax=Aliterella atlantica CENA595 TaxID=1618023 RepID=A0A0D8ZR12_9CYAN|nr:PD40 domain-containing protein [Aliterella atlantica]KJH69661.1 hypothetical protein UH38_22810 [Aliterella atlantica CENA595]